MLGGVTRHRVTSPTCGPPPSCKQALNDNEVDNDTPLQVTESRHRKRIMKANKGY